jgi:photosystem II stability/assembly factor-like uncharacterized protein
LKKSLVTLSVTAAALLLTGCFDNGSSAAPPTNMQATAGEGRVKVEWTAASGVDYWLFTATDAALSVLNWTGLANAHVYINATTPFYACGLLNDTPHYFMANGHINGGPGGAGSTQVSATPYNASDKWVAAPTIPTTNLNGVGYTGLTTCSNNSTSASGNFAAVGAGGAIYTSANNGQTWAAPTAAPSGLPDLYAVTGYAANQNNTASPGLRWIAVGAGGVSVYSTDGVTWQQGRSAAIPANPSLNAITQVAGTFFAVGDAANIYSTTDGTNWVAHTPATSVTTNNLRGIAHGTNYVAVGDGGAILTSADGNTWAAHTLTPALTSNLKQVASIGNVMVAVGDGGTIVASKDAGATWVVQTLAGAPNLTSVAAELQTKMNDVVDGWLGVAPTVQFVALDSNGNAYATQSNAANTGNLTWSVAIPTGASTSNALVGSGFGYVAVGNAGEVATAF